ncbi:MAG: dolichyl-phosphate beta-glucosyltransferase [Candidatus Omnitrophota bacterium]|jgi:dolichyl-phosphate beta-glucosyltransferase
MFISIIIPAYNEEERLKTAFEKLYQYLTGKKYDYEVIIVDDGSTDKTRETVSESMLAKAGKIIFLQNGKNKGKGFAVKQGILHSIGEYVLFSDADFSTPIQEFDKLFDYLKNGYDIAIGSRSVIGSNITVRQPLYREMMGKFFNFLVQIFVLRGIHDTQCGFKLFSGKCAKSIAQELKIDRFGFDVEMLYLAQKKKYKIKEVPVTWINSTESKVNPIKDSFKMFLELLSIKKLHG